MPRQIPGEKNSAKVASRVRLPISYTLEGADGRSRESPIQRKKIADFEKKMKRYGEVVINGSEVSAYI